jgi:hypothetical protein
VIGASYSLPYNHIIGFRGVMAALMISASFVESNSPPVDLSSLMENNYGSVGIK